MLSPPNQGMEIVDLLLHVPVYEWLAGPAGRELGSGPEALAHRLKPVEIEIGVIAGNRSMNPLFSAFIDGADDGRIPVESTKLPAGTRLVPQLSYPVRVICRALSVMISP